MEPPAPPSRRFTIRPRRKPPRAFRNGSATDGLRNITGIVNREGTATIYAITSTISGSGDQGADPNKLVMITDQLSATGLTPPAAKSFTTLRTAAYGEVLRGVSFTQGSVTRP